MAVKLLLLLLVLKLLLKIGLFDVSSKMTWNNARAIFKHSSWRRASKFSIEILTNKFCKTVLSLGYETYCVFWAFNRINCSHWSLWAIYATTNYVQFNGKFTASCQTCLHHVENFHPRVDSNPSSFSLILDIPSHPQSVLFGTNYINKTISFK